MVQLPRPASAGGLVQRRHNRLARQLPELVQRRQRLRTATAGDLNRRQTASHGLCRRRARPAKIKYNLLARQPPEDLHSEDTTASHGHCRRLEQKTRLPRTATAGGLEQQDTTASHGTAGRLLSATTQRPRMTTAGRLVAGLSQRSCRRSYRRRGLTRPLAGGLASHSARAGGLTEDEASHGHLPEDL